MKAKYCFLFILITVVLLFCGYVQQDEEIRETVTNKAKAHLITEQPEEKYSWHHHAFTTMFYAGEPGSQGASAWDVRFSEHYGGVDDPINRKHYFPASFSPRENPFYFALPYSDFTFEGERRLKAKAIPWYDQRLDKEGYSLIKNRWIEIKYRNKSCYGQWEDCGPVVCEHLECDDFDYVFGSANQPTKYPKSDNIPALDISPALRDCLGMNDPTDTVFGHRDDFTSWRFIDESDVPDGPWKEIITTSQIDWSD